MTIRIRQGTTFPANLTVQSEGVPVNLTGKVLVFSSNVATGFHLRTNVPGSGFVITDAPNGRASLTIPAATTRGWTPGTRYKYEIELWDGTNESVLNAGKIVVIEGINSDQP